MRNNILSLVVMLLMTAQPSLAFAESNVNNPGDALLTVEVTESAEKTTHVFGIEHLDALPQTSFETSTIWTEGVVTFSGPALSAVIESIGASSKTIRAFALNDYNMVIAEIGSSDAYPIVATRMDGERFSVRERGPLWLVYPYDSHPDFRDEKVYAQSIWQLYKLTLD